MSAAIRLAAPRDDGPRPDADILVFGGDGYIGWPLALELAAAYPEKRVLVVDNFLTRRNALKVGGRSLLPVAAMPERIAASREALGLSNLAFRRVDCTDTGQMTALFAEASPEVVYHLAHQRAAPYSMLGVREAIETVCNNEVGFLNLVWSIKDRCPDCHLVKLGSFGAYAKRGLDIPEGDARMAIDGRTSAEPLPFPRASDDFYHATKVNDGNFATVACRSWDLRITDVMQSTVFGAGTGKSFAHARLHTRFDYDAILGTVANRFVTQALAGVPLTVYGSGEQTTGIMTLEDCVTVLARLAYEPGPAGSLRIVNNVAGTYRINDLAELVRAEAARFGLVATIDRSGLNPRFETGAPPDYRVETAYLLGVLAPTPLDEAIARSIALLRPHAAGIETRNVRPMHSWMGAGTPPSLDGPVPAPATPAAATAAPPPGTRRRATR